MTILRRIVYIVSVVLLLFACDNGNVYKVEGRLSGLDNAALYVVYESSEGNTVDTLVCDEKGHFIISHEQDDNLQSITFYYNNREQWFTVYPETGKTVQVKGDAKYPALIEAKGGQINNKLSEFKRKAETILKEQADISDNKNGNSSSNSESLSKLATLHLELKRIAQDFISKNPREKASTVLIDTYFTHPEEMEQTEDLLDLLSPELDDYYIVKNLRSQIAKAKNSMEGVKAPDFRVTNIYGQTVTPDSFLNKYYILAFTALWCDMCQTDVMMLDEITTEYPKDSLEILLISLDDEMNEVRDMLRRDTIQWNLVTDSAGQAINLFEKYNVSSLPKCFLMDKDGIIKLRTANGVELKQTIDEIMK
ncbi:MAG: TlpA family protein disulfide reductase [Tannerella sp.]|jgi:peroxiredoxin|nr:TlpA family protein disulfide reductase [Tannerella sp.]